MILDMRTIDDVAVIGNAVGISNVMAIDEKA